MKSKFAVRRIPITKTGRIGTQLVMSLALAATVAFVGFGLFRLRQPVATAEVERSELVLRDGQMYRPGESQPFNGVMVEHYPNQVLQSRSKLLNGRLHGVSEGWHTNGQIQVREQFVKGISHGLRTKWYSNGSQQAEAMIVEGKHHGLFRRWHENGTLAEQVVMREGQPDGVAESFYPSAFLQARATLRNGRLISQEHWQDGERKQAPESREIN